MTAPHSAAFWPVPAQQGATAQGQPASGGGGAAGGDGSDDHPRPPGYTAMGPYGLDRLLKEASLVLRSMGIDHHTTWAVGGGYIIVRDHDYDRARSHLDRYEEENRDFPPRVVRERTRYGGPPVVALAFLALVVFAWITGPVATPHGAWFERGASISSRVLTSEPFRAVTALTLHADGAHVMSNLISGAVFGRAVERRFGPGAALLSIVGAGALGNIANAGFFASEGIEHRSIGASTAVFGAIGLLAASQLVLGGARSVGPKAKRHFTEYLAPIVGGVALLGALGSGPETDVFAHAFGLVAGLLLGIPIAFAIRRWHRAYVWRGPLVAAQILAGVTALAVVGVSWAFAVRAL